MNNTNGTEVIAVTIPPQDDAEAKIAALEAEKNAIAEREANYKAAYLKEKAKNKEYVPEDETEDERVRRITREELANSRLAQIDTEKEALLHKTLKENKELKLAQLSRIGASAAVGTHTESQAVTSTILTPDQRAYFKSLGKDDKWIERYIRNLQKNPR